MTVWWEIKKYLVLIAARTEENISGLTPKSTVCSYIFETKAGTCFRIAANCWWACNAEGMDETTAFEVFSLSIASSSSPSKMMRKTMFAHKTLQTWRILEEVNDNVPRRTYDSMYINMYTVYIYKYTFTFCIYIYIHSIYIYIFRNLEHVSPETSANQTLQQVNCQIFRFGYHAWGGVWNRFSSFRWRSRWGGTSYSPSNLR